MGYYFRVSFQLGQMQTTTIECKFILQKKKKKWQRDRPNKYETHQSKCFVVIWQCTFKWIHTFTQTHIHTQLAELSSCCYNGRKKIGLSTTNVRSTKIKGRCVFSTILMSNCLPTKLKRFHLPRVKTRMLYAYHISMYVCVCVWRLCLFSPCLIYFILRHIFRCFICHSSNVRLCYVFHNRPFSHKPQQMQLSLSLIFLCVSFCCYFFYSFIYFAFFWSVSLNYFIMSLRARCLCRLSVYVHATLWMKSN